MIKRVLPTVYKCLDDYKWKVCLMAIIFLIGHLNFLLIIRVLSSLHGQNAEASQISALKATRLENTIIIFEESKWEALLFY